MHGTARVAPPMTPGVMSRRMSIKGKFILGCIFFGGMGIVSLYIALDIFITGTGPQGQNLILNESNNPFVKYAIGYLFAAFSIPCVAFPFLSYKGVLTLDYQNSTQFIKAKHNFVLCTLMLPAASILILLFFVKGCNSGLNCKVGIIAALLFGGFYLYSFLVLIKGKNQ